MLQTFVGNERLYSVKERRTFVTDLYFELFQQLYLILYFQSTLSTEFAVLLVLFLGVQLP